MKTSPIVRQAIASTSMSAMAVLLFATTTTAAHAQNECGEPVDGQVVCTPAQQPFDKGISYDTPADIAIGLKDGLALAPDSGSAGVIAISREGSVRIDGSGTSIGTRDATGAVAHGLGDVTVNLGTVTSVVTRPGELAWGINTFSSYGTTTINVDEVHSTGDDSFAIIAESTSGDILINAGLVSTNGFASDTIKVITGGNVDIRVDRIESSGEYVWGVNLVNGNVVDEQVIGGFSNIAIGSIAIDGTNNIGVSALTLGDIYIDVGNISMTGDGNTGVSLLTDSNGIIRIGELNMSGNGSTGVFTQALGALSITVDKASFAGEGGQISAFSGAGEANLTIGSYTGGAGIIASSGSNSATVRVDTITTGGDFATAASATARILAGSVTARGLGVKGLWASGLSTIVNLTGPLIVEGDGASGVTSISTGGEGLVVTAGTITAHGAKASGVGMTARYGGGTIRAGAAIDVAGEGAAGIRADGEGADLLIEAQDIKANGAGSTGILARTDFPGFFIGADSGPLVPRDGNIDIRVANLAATGEGAIGISAMGLGKATILAGNVSAVSGHAIETDMIGTATLDLRGAVRSDTATAISAKAANVSIDIAAGGSVFGGQDAILIEAVGERCALPDPGNGTINPCPVPGTDSGDGGGIGIGALQPGATLALAGTASIVNRGTIEGGQGHAVRADAGAVSLTNHGQIVGAVKFAGGGDLFDNRGTFLISKDSDFGAGIDTLRNSGVVKLATARTPARFALLGLERFENSGAVDLRNGAVGDTLTLSGDYRGTSGARLLLDVDTAGGKADRFVVTGAATGSTLVDLAIDPADAVLTDADGISLIGAGKGSTADAFRIAPSSLEIGFVRYTLAQSDGDYALVGRAGSAAYRQLGALQAADQVWDASADLWRQNGLGQRDAQLGGQAIGSRRVWGALQGGHVSRDWTAEGNGDSADLSYRQSRQGGQVGLDLLGAGDDAGALRLGVTAGYTQSDFDYRAAGDSIDLSTGNVGLYAGYVGEALFANLLVKYDRHDIKLKTVALEGGAKIDGSTWGADGEFGVRLGSAGLFVEPLLGVAWTRSSVDTLQSGRQQIRFDDSNGVKGRIGARIGGTSAFASGAALTIYASGHAVHQFGDDYALELVSGARETIRADRIGTYSEGRFGLSYRTPAGFEAFAESQGEVGGGYDALAGRVGVRIGF